ncbi:phage tail protein [Plantibacter sp. Mn2098]|uniref:phage tail protein n=1 Tax=Plantibacter sp. Mn2098 TaxID=3395266 RepID=UPI003BDF7387
MTAVEIADAYIALYAKMPGVKGDIEKSLGGSDVQGAADDAGKKSGNSFTAGLGKIIKGGAIALAATAAAGLGVALVKGFGRLDAIDTAEKKLTGLGQSTENVTAIMDNARAAVKGTAFGLGDAATAAASLVAANIKPGEQLQGVLKSVANSAAAAGVGIGDMGSIYAKVSSLGKAQNDVLQQVADKGIPIYQTLADKLGVTTDEVFKMASAGKIGFAEFEDAMTTASGTVADEMGKTLPGALDNFFSSLGRIGAGLLGGIYPLLAPLVQAITSALGPVEDFAAKIGEKIAGVVAPAIQWLIDLLNGGLDLGGFAELLSYISPLGLAFKILEPVLPTLMQGLVDIGAALGGALITALQAVVPAITTLATVLSGVLAATLPQLVPLLETIAGAFGTLLVAVAPLVGELITALVPVFNLLPPIVETLLEALMPIIPVVIDLASSLISTLIPIIVGLLDAILPVIPTVLDLAMTLVSMLVPVIEQLAPILVALVDAFAPLLGVILTPLIGLITALMPVITPLLDVFIELLQPILGLITPLLDLVNLILPPLTQIIGILATMLSDQLSTAFKFLMPIIKGVVSMITDVLTPVIKGITDVLGGVITFITGVFTGNWRQAWDGIVQIFSGIWNGITGVVKGVINGIIDLINGVIGGINEIASGVKNATGGAINLSIGTIPKLAQGGIIAARPGGMIATIGEGRYDEAVVPLTPEFKAAMAGGGGKQVTLVQKITTVQDDPRVQARQWGREMLRGLNAQ